MIIDLDLSTATASNTNEILVTTNAISLIEHSTEIQTDTELLLRFEEQYGSFQDSSGKAPAVISHGGVFHGEVFEDCKGYGVYMNGSGGLRIDSYPNTRTNTFTIKCIIRPADISGKKILFHKQVTDNTLTWSFYLSSGTLYFEYKSLLQDESVVIASSLSVNEDETSLIGLSFDPSAIRFSVNGSIETQSISIAPQIYDAGAMYIGFDGSVDNYIGYMDEIEFLSSAIVSFPSSSDNLYSIDTPYIDIDIPISMLDLGGSGNVNMIKLLNIDLTSSSSSKGVYGVSLGEYGSNKFISARESTEQLSHQTFICYDGTQVEEEFNKNITRFTQIIDPSFTNDYLTLRIYFISDGRQPVTLTGIKLSYIDSTYAISAGDNKNVIFGESFRPFSDGGSHFGMPVSITRNNLPYTYPIHLIFYDGKDYNNQDIDDNAEFQYLKSVILTADNYLIYPTKAESLIGEGQLSTDVDLAVNSGSYTDNISVTVRPYWIQVLTRDAIGDVILSTLGDSAPKLTIYDSNENIIVEDYLLTGDDYFSLLGDNYTFKIEQVDYADQSFEIDIDSDRIMELLIAPPKLRGLRQSYDTSIYFESIYVDHDIHTIVQSDTPTVTFRIIDADTGLSKNITGFRAYFRARMKYGTQAVIIDRECTVSTEEQGIATVKLTSNDTSINGEYVGELTIVSGNTTLTPLSKILFTIQSNIS